MTVEVYYPVDRRRRSPACRATSISRARRPGRRDTPSYRDVAHRAGPLPAGPVLARQRRHPLPVVLLRRASREPRLRGRAARITTATRSSTRCSGIVDPNVAANRPLDLSFLHRPVLRLRRPRAGNFFAGTIDTDAHRRLGPLVRRLHGVRARRRPEPARARSPIRACAPSCRRRRRRRSRRLLRHDHHPDAHPRRLDRRDHAVRLAAARAVRGAARGRQRRRRSAQLTDAGHFTFSDFCEVQRDLLAFLGGFDEACEPRHLPWRRAHDIVELPVAQLLRRGAARRPGGARPPRSRRSVAGHRGPAGLAQVAAVRSCPTRRGRRAARSRSARRPRRGPHPPARRGTAPTRRRGCARAGSRRSTS